MLVNLKLNNFFLLQSLYSCFLYTKLRTVTQPASHLLAGNFYFHLNFSVFMRVIHLTESRWPNEYDRNQWTWRKNWQGRTLTFEHDQKYYCLHDQKLQNGTNRWRTDKISGGQFNICLPNPHNYFWLCSSLYIWRGPHQKMALIF